MNTTLPLSMFVAWLASGERGLSSEAIVSQLTGQPVGRYYGAVRGTSDHPFDPSDFRRCERLLRIYPLARLVFKAEMSKRSPEWAALVGAWDELVALAESEVPGVFGGATGSLPLTYARMKELTGRSAA